MFTIKSDFIGYFTLGDNINYNLSILGKLYLAQKQYDIDSLQKPIVILIASICEAVLSDLYYRINEFTAEGVRDLEDVADAIRKKHLDQFEHYIANSKKHNLFGEDCSFYDDLTGLRKLRNRVHIQNSKAHFEVKEVNVFTVERQTKAERVAERLLKMMAKKYPRDESFGYFVDDFKIPWNEHIGDIR